MAIRGVRNSRRPSMGVLVALLVASTGWAEQARAQAGPVQTTGSSTILREGDILQIDVWPNTELSGEFTIEDDGFVYLPLLAAVRAAGVSVDDFRVDLRRRYGEVQRNPVVTVTPRFQISVTGAVQRPGVLLVTPNTSLLDAVTLSGGFQNNANAQNVRIVRPGEVTTYDAVRALETGQGMEAIALRSGDHIFVPIADPPLLTFRNVISALNAVASLLFIWDRFVR